MNDKDKSKVMEKIRKLLVLATNEGATENEAATAMRQARSLMDKYQINQIDIEKMDKNSHIKGEEADSQSWNKKIPPWLSRLCVAVAKLNDCIVSVEYVDPNDLKSKIVLRFKGLEGDAISASLMFKYLKDNCDVRFRKFAKERELKGTPRGRAQRDFRHTYAQTINGLIAQMIKDREEEIALSSSKELMVVKGQLVREKFGDPKYGKSRRRKVRSSEAAQAGRATARRAHLGRSVSEAKKGALK